MLGHRDPRSTRRYADVTEDQVRGVGGAPATVGDPMPVDFLTDEQAACYGRYNEEPNPVQLAR